jgi:glycosyltransferase involved in cell wall biosynthesis
MDMVEQSMLAPAAAETRVIPNGVDLEVFHPAEQRRVRAKLSLPADANVLLFAAHQWIRESRAKDYGTIRNALSIVGERLGGQRTILVALGEDSPAERLGAAEIRFVPFQRNPDVVAAYYQAADVYVHAAHADTFPTTILEALACGTPVVATNVCGIPEQIKGLVEPTGQSTVANRYELHEATGILVPPQDAPEMAAAIMRILSDESLRLRLAANARQDACARFDLQRQIDDYVHWYMEILHRRSSDGAAAGVIRDTESPLQVRMPETVPQEAGR